MNIDQDPRVQVLSELLHAKEWHRVLPDQAIDLLVALLDEGPHVRDALDARLRRSAVFPEGLATRFLLSDSYQERSLGELLDLMIAGRLVVSDDGEYEINDDAPHLLDPAARPLLELLEPQEAGSGSHLVTPSRRDRGFLPR